jgi:hypothetical protein
MMVGVLIALAAVNPEALMARGILARYGSPFPVDYAYVQGSRRMSSRSWCEPRARTA